MQHGEGREDVRLLVYQFQQVIFVLGPKEGCIVAAAVRRRSVLNEAQVCVQSNWMESIGSNMNLNTLSNGDKR